MKHSILIATASIIASCATQKPITNQPPAIEKDSVRVETRYILQELIDTCYITLPSQFIEKVTPDTTSTLETDYAKSTASILPSGMLQHFIETKDIPIPVPVKTTERRIDSLIYIKEEVPVPYPVTQEVEVNRLTWLQQAQIYTCRILLALALVLILWKKSKKFAPFAWIFGEKA